MKKMMGPFLCFLLLSVAGIAQKSEIFNTSDGAIHGYDPVAYFNEHKAMKGDHKNAVYYKESTWYFVDRKNLELFKQNPQMYAPQYGGYCAYGLADGHKAPTDPQAWTIVNGKLYLNYDKDVQSSWNKKQGAYIQTADKLWPELKDKK